MKHARAATAVAIALGLVAASGCKKDAPAGVDAGAAASPAVASAGASAAGVAEALPRCRPDANEATIAGDDVVVGDAVATSDAIVLGVLRRVGGKRVGSIVRMPLDLAPGGVKAIDVGPAFGEEPPPSPRVVRGAIMAAWYTRKAGDDAGAPTTGGMAPGTRTLHVGHLEGDALREHGAVVQQADESSAFDVAWPSGAASPGTPPLVAWDEDAPIAVGAFLPDRGRVKTTVLGSKDPDGGAPKIAVVSPYATDADSPRLLARARAGQRDKPGGFWLAWLARRPESSEDAGLAPEGPGEQRAFRWVEIVELGPSGEPIGPIRRVSPERGHVVSFDLVRAPGGAGTEAVVVAQDEAAHQEHAGARIVRYPIAEKADATELVDAGVGHALAEIVESAPASPASARDSASEADAGSARWLAWTDAAEHAHLLPLGAALTPGGAATLEPALDAARVLAAAPDALYVLSGSTVRRVSCR